MSHSRRHREPFETRRCGHCGADELQSQPHSPGCPKHHRASESDDKPTANALTEDVYKSLLERFNGGPGVTEGLSHQQTVDMLVYAVTNGKAEQDGLSHWVEAYKDGGLLPQA
jgi:hypothetical protein